MTSLKAPAAGVRFVVELASKEATAMTYRGVVQLQDEDLPLVVTVALPSGACSALIEAKDHEALAKQASALVRAATKTAVAEGLEPPRKIVRWRG